MEEVFENLIKGFINNKIGIAENFISHALAERLKQSIFSLQEENLLLPAGTGNAEKLNHNTAIRSDTIYWLDKNHNDPHENEFLTTIETFIKYLNLHCYAGISDYEFHYSIYKKGSYYIKHLDQFKNDSHRAYSMISYLNADWQEADGGELLVQLENKQQKIAPTQGKTVLFKSNELPHEVLLTHKTRLSVTGWLKKS